MKPLMKRLVPRKRSFKTPDRFGVGKKSTYREEESGKTPREVGDVERADCSNSWAGRERQRSEGRRQTATASKVSLCIH